jgi:hypothetical protein
MDSQVPKGTAEKFYVPQEFHSSLRGLFADVGRFPAINRWAILSRPFGTKTAADVKAIKRGCLSDSLSSVTLQFVLVTTNQYAVPVDVSRGRIKAQTTSIPVFIPAPDSAAGVSSEFPACLSNIPSHLATSGDRVSSATNISPIITTSITDLFSHFATFLPDRLGRSGIRAYNHYPKGKRYNSKCS